ncbi:MAG: hypothetical protein O7C98_15515 [Planctomycetota bacterium]|nr:hypothetical protein [Planctomycetota bacterium]
MTRRIGLSLGADICWPICYEDLVDRLDRAIPVGGDRVRLEIERLTIEPFDLRQASRFDVVIDRLTHWYGPSREWIKKAIILNGLYVFNNPWSVQAMEKHTAYCAMMRLGMPVPDTWLIPPKEYDESPDLQPTLERYAQLFDLPKIAAGIGYPSFIKPYDGGGWVGVSRIDDESGLRDAYEKSGKFVMHLQAGVVPFEHFVRCIGIGPQVHVVRYDPSAPLHARYLEDRDFIGEDDASMLRDMTLTINAFFGWDFNSCEALLKDGVWYPIDFANPCPDAQVTSLHVHFPWVVKAKLRWSVFCAVTGRKMRQNLDWEPFYEIADRDLPGRQKLAAYAAVARERFDTERFEEFCAEHLSQLDEVAWDYFGTDRARGAVRQKIEALFPEHEWDEFTDYFWERIQRWREWDAAARAAS